MIAVKIKNLFISVFFLLMIPLACYFLYLDTVNAPPSDVNGGAYILVLGIFIPIVFFLIAAHIIFMIYSAYKLSSPIRFIYFLPRAGDDGLFIFKMLMYLLCLAYLSLMLIYLLIGKNLYSAAFMFTALITTIFYISWISAHIYNKKEKETERD